MTSVWVCDPQVCGGDSFVRDVGDVEGGRAERVSRVGHALRAAGDLRESLTD